MLVCAVCHINFGRHSPKMCQAIVLSTCIPRWPDARGTWGCGQEVQLSSLHKHISIKLKRGPRPKPAEVQVSPVTVSQNKLQAWLKRSIWHASYSLSYSSVWNKFQFVHGKIYEQTVWFTWKLVARSYIVQITLQCKDSGRVTGHECVTAKRKGRRKTAGKVGKVEERLQEKLETA